VAALLAEDAAVSAAMLAGDSHGRGGCPKCTFAGNEPGAARCGVCRARLAKPMRTHIVNGRAVEVADDDASSSSDSDGSEGGDPVIDNLAVQSAIVLTAERAARLPPPERKPKVTATATKDTAKKNRKKKEAKERLAAKRDAREVGAFGRGLLPAAAAAAVAAAVAGRAYWPYFGGRGTAAR
jgi:hypothetical protein